MDVLVTRFWIEIGVAILCGGMVGLERQIRGKPAGIRTCIMICLGTTVFIALGRTFANSQTDSTRILGQVITGIGFLGAGVIIAQGGLVKGVTSSAIIWVLAAIGSMIGFGRYAEAVAVASVTVGLLTGIELIEENFPRLQKGVHASSDDLKSRKE